MIVKGSKGYAGVIWNIDEEDTEKEIALPVPDSAEQTLVVKTVDEETTNPLKLWHHIGEPAYPTKEETELIKSAAYPAVSSSVVAPVDDLANIKITVRRNGVVYFTLTKRNFTPDRGYDYDRVISFH